MLLSSIKTFLCYRYKPFSFIAFLSEKRKNPLRSLEEAEKQTDADDNFILYYVYISKDVRIVYGTYSNNKTFFEANKIKYYRR